MSAESSRPTVLFRVAAGPRIGFGHLVRALSLAEALEVEPLVSLRGTRDAHRIAARLGARLAPRGTPRRILASVRPALLVIDDRVAGETAGWRRAARAAGLPIASVHDLGLGLGDADLVIDASIRRVGETNAPARRGPAYAILRPALARLAAHGQRGSVRRILIALGGGPRAAAAAAIARTLTVAHPGVEVVVAGGFVNGRRPADTGGVRRVGPGEFDSALARADLVVTAGGVTLLEACSLGVPAVAVAVVPSQRPTIEDLAAKQAALDAGLLVAPYRAAALQPVISAVARLCGDARLRARLSRNGRRLVDGHGAARVAADLRRLVQRARRAQWTR